MAKTHPDLKSVMPVAGQIAELKNISSPLQPSIAEQEQQKSADLGVARMELPEGSLIKGQIIQGQIVDVVKAKKTGIRFVSHADKLGTDQLAALKTPKRASNLSKTGARLTPEQVERNATIRKLMKAFGGTQSEVARLTGFSTQHVSGVFTDTVPASIRMVEKFQELVGPSDGKLLKFIESIKDPKVKECFEEIMILVLSAEKKKQASIVQRILDFARALSGSSLH